MRLWHEKLITKLPRQQLLGQHRECCALRGNGWGKSHAIVNYVFHYSPYRLFLYHQFIMEEMKGRGYRVDPLWENAFYRGKQCKQHTKESLYAGEENISNEWPVYPEHDDTYLQECVVNLKEKGIDILV
ncbi:TIGR02328 family protein [Virgibacillus sp. Bac330]|uniref:TIGR02328 family protein n=1 Tax=Virgibacillus sp. Bac330 TaxID=2419841 RepID=UPI000EF45B34|nr:TIGR02328 family protein [Virgibacillus sp. Bac330]